MSERKDSKTRRNYLVKCNCPNCSQDSEHSFSRVQKGAQLICPYCHKLFQSSTRTAA
ncbi:MULTISPECIES: YnfU family zinc-binding protein [unclassified Klebsiella]|uniref:YnfU family zinc-binding protein n=1 Tax=unclassified Klebsiella TaxID=2608929 RepID=UPI001C685B33|nr:MULTISPECIES: YnfU family zinc-binding protein [unclassified Klebsiella]